MDNPHIFVISIVVFVFQDLSLNNYHFQMDDFSIECWTERKRKEELKKRGLKLTGNKNAQVNRLKKDEENKRRVENITSTFSSATSLLPLDIPMQKLPTKSPSSGKRYCIVCRNYQGKKMDDGTIFSLHRFPEDTDLRDQLEAHILENAKNLAMKQNYHS